MDILWALCYNFQHFSSHKCVTIYTSHMEPADTHKINIPKRVTNLESLQTVCYTELYMDNMNIMTGECPTGMRTVLALREKVGNRRLAYILFMYLYEIVQFCSYAVCFSMFPNAAASTRMCRATNWQHLGNLLFLLAKCQEIRFLL
jgi:hypothetical protein